MDTSATVYEICAWSKSVTLVITVAFPSFMLCFLAPPFSHDKDYLFTYKGRYLGYESWCLVHMTLWATVKHGTASIVGPLIYWQAMIAILYIIGLLICNGRWTKGSLINSHCPHSVDVPRGGLTLETLPATPIRHDWSFVSHCSQMVGASFTEPLFHTPAINGETNQLRHSAHRGVFKAVQSPTNKREEKRDESPVFSTCTGHQWTLM